MYLSFYISVTEDDRSANTIIPMEKSMFTTLELVEAHCEGIIRAMKSVGKNVICEVSAEKTDGTLKVLETIKG